ncbi:hypothetical protein HY68_14395 [Streptomyces sp. AcH 505]|uniref:DUF397 domain-containing protein n=1 Tax=Streptomyces sp. AcH 505 TaxID=352211 RepID=UPI000591CD96|nr:hypothetical protein HY68_14395 [Streptomyces sp. AcH 505]
MTTKADTLTGANWFKSSYSNGSGGNCVEGARLADGVMAVRDSKSPHGPALLFPVSAWLAFTKEYGDR